MSIENIQINPISADVESDRASSKKLPTEIEIQDWLISYIAELLQIEANELDVRTSFDRYGLDSVAAYELTGDLATWLNRELDPTLIYNYPTIETFTQQLIEELEVSK